MIGFINISPLTFRIKFSIYTFVISLICVSLCIEDDCDTLVKYSSDCQRQCFITMVPMFRGGRDSKKLNPITDQAIRDPYESD